VGGAGGGVVVGVAVGGSDVVVDMTSAAVSLTVPFPELQQARAMSSWPQQKTL